MPTPKIPEGYDFGGYITKYEVPCTDGRTIKTGAFAHQDGDELPLVWGHDHNNPSNVIGKILLKALPDGMYGFGSLNNTPRGNDSRELLAHGDIKAMSIFANHLKEQSKCVMHGLIREVSLVLVGANPGAFIDNLVVQHGDDDYVLDSEAIICFTEDNDFVRHCDQEFDDEMFEHEDSNLGDEANESLADNQNENSIEHADKEETELNPVLTEEEYNSVMADLDEIGDMLDSFEQEVNGAQIRHDAFDDPETALVHYASPYYDPVYAHEYYMAHRKLKGRKTSGVDTTELNKEGRKKAKNIQKEIDEDRDDAINSYKQTVKKSISGDKERTISERNKARKKMASDIKSACSKTKDQIKAAREKYNDEISKYPKGSTEANNLKAQKLKEIASLRDQRNLCVSNLSKAYKKDSESLTEAHKNFSSAAKKSFDEYKADKIIESENDYANVVEDLSKMAKYMNYAIVRTMFKDDAKTTYADDYKYDSNNKIGKYLKKNEPDSQFSYQTGESQHERPKKTIQHSDSDSDTTIGDILDTLNEKQENVLEYLIEEMMNSDTVSHSEEEAINTIIDNQNGSSIEHADDNETVGDILNTFNKDQKDVLVYLMAKAYEEKSIKHSDEGGKNIMNKNIFETEETTTQNTLSHSDIKAIMDDAKASHTSLKEAFLAHAASYGIENIEYLFPDAQLVDKKIEMLRNNPTDWVAKVMNGVRKSPFSRIKSMQADITADTARARGYVKGAKKVEEVLSLLKRTTSPQTVYKLQKLDRDDILDITDIDVVAWIKAEMRIMLEEEIARAILVGDGRSAVSSDKIKPDNIRPILTDYADDLYAIRHVYTVPNSADPYLTFIDECVIAAIKYEGTGNPTLYTTPEWAARMQLVRDTQGNRLYKTRSELADACGVKEIVEVPYMKNQTFENAEGDTCDLKGIIVNLADYTVGADKGGAVNLFDDFNLDYNQYQYLMETRFSGALTKPHSALILGTQQD